MGRTRNLTRAERERARTRFNAMLDVRDREYRAMAEEVQREYEALDEEQKRARADAAFRKFGGPA